MDNNLLPVDCMEVSDEEEGVGNVGVGVTNGTQLDDGRWNRQASSAPLNTFLSSGDQGAREAHWASHTQSLYPIPAKFPVQSQNGEPSLRFRMTLQKNSAIGSVMLLSPPLILPSTGSGHGILWVKTMPSQGTWFRRIPAPNLMLLVNTRKN